MADSTSSVSSRVQAYLSRNPALRHALSLGVINYSALARHISEQTGIEEQFAISIALRRAKARVANKTQSESLFAKTLRKARLVVRNRMATIALTRPANSKDLDTILFSLRESFSEVTIVEGHSLISLILPDELVPDCKKQFRNQLQYLERELVQLTLIFDQKVISLPGFSSYLHGLFGGEGINIYGDATCSGEHLIIIKERDLSRTLGILR